MSLRSHASVSLIISGIVSFLIGAAPGGSMLWGAGLVAAGVVIGVLRLVF
ncbi:MULTISPECIES: hypothetical protein [unclassified Haladaptatus]|nr:MULTISPECIES: hypothetical protein [unclassified Haladaptatus]MCO8242511.1 hypothetical protein [Haladaptatus sp. AB643]MCO8252268.1 hypothetical protein [Haladaptatus sp. AB618]